ncbi:hypothetical protein MAHJHV29_48430 [Mycobacterium avium subsp. hominissuis]
MAEGEQVLAARRRVLGADHTDTLGTQLMLSIWRGRGDVAGAAPPDRQHQLRAQGVGVIGAEHPAPITPTPWARN